MIHHLSNQIVRLPVTASCFDYIASNQTFLVFLNILPIGIMTQVYNERKKKKLYAQCGC